MTSTVESNAGIETEQSEAPDGADTAAPIVEAEGGGLRVWIPAARPPVVSALENAGATVLDDPEGAEYAVISTRLARHRIGEYAALARECGLTVLVLVHPGGEAQAVEALRSGGRTAIAEGDVEALRSLHVGDGDEEESDASRVESLLDAFETRLGRSQATTLSSITMVDPVSGLPAAGALQIRLGETLVDPEVRMRVVSLSVPALAENTRLRLGIEGYALLHRRIANGMRLMCQTHGELFDMGDGSFVLLAPNLGIPNVALLGEMMVEMVEAYMPDGHLPLAVAVGHAGPECSLDMATLRELAGRAEAAARQEERSTVLGAGELVKSLASATELEVTMRLAQVAAEREGATARDEVASELAVRLGFEGRERLLVRFCATVSDIGSALVDEGDDHSEVVSALLGPLAGRAVGAVLRAIDEHWDGSGRPDGLAGSAIPVSARIIAVADQLVADGYATTALEAGAETRFDPTVVRAAMELAQQR
jgi:hypothetical protein